MGLSVRWKVAAIEVGIEIDDGNARDSDQSTANGCR